MPHTDTSLSDLSAFQWAPQPAAGRFVRQTVEKFLAEFPQANQFALRLYHESGNRFVDLVDTLWLPAAEQELDAVGWTKGVDLDGRLVRTNPSGMFPAIVRREPSEGVRIDLKVDSVSDFVAAHNLDVAIEGRHYGPYRQATVFEFAGMELGVCERHGYRGYDTGAPGPSLDSIYRTLESFQTRRRVFENDTEGYALGLSLIERAIGEVGRDMACDLFFRAEREYWQRRNRAAKYQYDRQQKLGIGWANHDHHTYRNSRKTFHLLVQMWEMLGFECRERFSPGVEAGWGAQVMEQPVCGIITFNDVDISPAELLGDFAHRPLSEWDRLHTVGLWCGLHGESFLQAGMHHLECTFDFDGFREQITAEAGIGVMKPFTDYPHLRQAFTEGERWPVDPRRAERLVRSGLITRAEADRFIAEGAIGSHLENLERNDGFKGFNQKGVTEIIAATDPRKQMAAAGR